MLFFSDTGPKYKADLTFSEIGISPELHIGFAKWVGTVPALTPIRTLANPVGCPSALSIGFEFIQKLQNCVGVPLICVADLRN